MILWIPLAFGISLSSFAAEEEEAPNEEEPTLAISGPDRSGPPPISEAKPLELPAPKPYPLSDSTTAYYVHVPGVRKVSINVFLHRGATDLGGPNALTDALGDLQDRASENYDAKSLEIATDLHDISIGSSMHLQYATVSLEVPVDELDKGLEILEEILRRPSFPKEEVKRNAIEELLYLYEEGPNSARALAGSAASYGWYPEDSPYGARPDLLRIKKTKTADLVKLHAKLLAMAPVSVLVVGNVEMAAIEDQLKALIGDIGMAGERPEGIPFSPPTSQRVIAIDLPGNPQTRVSLRMAAPLFDHADRPVAEVVNYALGGHFLSRLNTNLREEKGFTYGARSTYFFDRQRGSWVVSVDVATENVAATAVEIQREVQRLMDEGVTESEIQMAKNSFIATWNSTMETAYSASAEYSDRLVNEIDLDQLREELGKIDAITVAQTRTISKKYLADEQPYLWVFVGDRKLLESQLTAFGDKVEWLDRKDVILGAL
jgi:zinc protease